MTFAVICSIRQKLFASLLRICKLAFNTESLGFPGGSAGKESACNVRNLGQSLGRSPGEGNRYQLQYSGLENSMDCIVHGVPKSQTRLSDFHVLTHAGLQ